MNDESEGIIAQLCTLKLTLQKDMRIKRQRVFGSVARGDAGPDSDVDLIVDFAKKPSLLGFIGIKQEMEYKPGRKVDLVTLDIIDKYTKNRVLREAQHV